MRTAAILRSRKAMTLLALLAAYALWEMWLTIDAPKKVAGEFPARDRVNVLVTLPFAPERFHVQVFQGYGRVSGTNDNTVEVRGVKRKDLGAVARPYWVRSVEPLREDQR